MGKALYQRLLGDHFLTPQRELEPGHNLRLQEFGKQDRNGNSVKQGLKQILLVGKHLVNTY